MSVTSELSSDAGVLTIRVSGRFDFSSHQEFRKAYETVSQSNISYVIDMGEAEYLDSSALGMLLLMREHAGGDHAKIRIVNCRPQIKNILKVANFAKLFTVE
ncbi:MAG: STAS domain-containing protein [Myxococcota bacterium]|jgi:anti-anti-sigma factor|nr:STAS domain-containing protein [Myxococcota bacterium]